jgi:hypothetical protein
MASQQITEEAVYLCTGNPLPKDIEQISYWLLNESFGESFKRMQRIFFLSFFFLSTAIVTTSDISVQVSISPIIYLFMFVLFVLNSHRNI